MNKSLKSSAGTKKEKKKKTVQTTKTEQISFANTNIQW